jgi:hypothetical protein
MNTNKAPKVYCLLCSKPIKFQGDIDFNKYTGQVCCEYCNTLLDITITKYKLSRLKVNQKGFRELTFDEALKGAEQTELQMRKNKELTI